MNIFLPVVSININQHFKQDQFRHQPLRICPVKKQKTIKKLVCWKRVDTDDSIVECRVRLAVALSLTLESPLLALTTIAGPASVKAIFLRFLLSPRHTKNQITNMINATELVVSVIKRLILLEKHGIFCQNNADQKLQGQISWTLLGNGHTGKKQQKNYSRDGLFQPAQVQFSISWVWLNYQCSLVLHLLNTNQNGVKASL